MFSIGLYTFVVASCCSRFADSQSASGSVVSLINSNGLQGNLEFFPKTTGLGVTIRVLLRGETQGEKYRWKIHEFPIRPSSPDDCRQKKYGRRVHDFTKSHDYLTSGQDSMIASSVNLEGPDSIVGRTLVLSGVNRGQVLCAPIRPTSRAKTFRAVFHTPIGGEAYIRQTKFGTYIFSDLYYVNGTRKTTAHRWALVRTSETDSFEDGHRQELSRCANIRAIDFLPPFSKSSSYLSVGHTPGIISSRTFHQLGDVPSLETIPGSLYLVVYSPNNPGRIMACSRVLPLPMKQATATFSSGVTGEISFRQSSPYDAAMITIDIDDLQQKAYSYGVDDLPVMHRGRKQHFCPNIARVMYNPLKVSPSSVPEPGSGTIDQYAAGDLSGKYGPLQNRKKFFYQVYDPQVTLHGPMSVVGRALVIYFPDGKPLACANIELSGGETITAFSTLVHPIQGQAILWQEKDDPNSETSVYIELSHASTKDQSTTFNHGWYIAEQELENASGHGSDSECSLSGSVYDPYAVDVSGSYSCLCSSSHPLRCRVGDLSLKLSRLDVPLYQYTRNETKIARYFFTASNIPLTGPASVIGKSLVIERADFVEKGLTCANIYEYVSKVALRK